MVGAEREEGNRVARSRQAALVTGASQGIGAAAAVALAREGYDVAVTSTRPEKLARVLEAIEAAGASALGLALDVREQASIERALSEALRAFGRLDVLVNNAAVPLKKDAVAVSRAEWDEVIHTGLTGTYFMSQAMARHLIAAGRPGCIVNLASTHGLVGVPQRSVYGIAKAGVVHLTRALAVEWAPHGIRVNAIAPGRVETESRAGSLADPAYREWALERIPLRRFATADEVAAAVCYLASPAAAYVTGHTLVLDGGLTAY
jgi:NAD(P)-dependent dehydrogenase (short-subunit alcohol dehydrogenase family)